jgi:hypothetical protein
VILVVESHALEPLHEADAVEDAAAHEARALEGVAALAHDDDRLLARLQALHHLRIGGFAEQAAPDRRDRRRCRIEVDEGVVRRPLLRTIDRLGVAGTRIGVVDLGDAEMKAAHRAVADQRLPILDIALAEIDRGHDHRSPRHRGRRLADAAGLHHLQRRTDDAVADDEDRHGGAADDVRSRYFGSAGGDGPDIGALEVVDDGADFLLGNTDEHDRLMMLHEPGADELGGGIEGYEDMNRLARIAGRIDDIGIEVGEAEQLIALKYRRHRGRAFGCAEPIGAVD